MRQYFVCVLLIFLSRYIMGELLSSYPEQSRNRAHGLDSFPSLHIIPSFLRVQPELFSFHLHGICSSHTRNFKIVIVCPFLSLKSCQWTNPVDSFPKYYTFFPLYCQGLSGTSLSHSRNNFGSSQTGFSQLLRSTLPRVSF